MIKPTARLLIVRRVANGWTVHIEGALPAEAYVFATPESLGAAISQWGRMQMNAAAPPPELPPGFIASPGEDHP